MPVIPTPAPSTGLGSTPARLVRADGSTVITASSGAALISAAPMQDPPVVVAEDIYQDRVPDGTSYPPIERVLKFNGGQVIPTSQWNACFPAATVGSVTPATGPAAGGTAVTVAGTSFTPDTTLTFGGVAATSVVVVSPDLLTCVTPAHADGAVSVVVTTDSGATTATGLYTYVG
jgi:hypothetical protein